MATNFIIAQLNPVVGDIEGNAQRVLAALQPFAEDGDAFVVFPELVITGYPPEDLLTRPAFVDDAMQALESIVAASEKFKCSALVGGVWQDGELTYNAALLICDGQIRHIHKKNSLPNYGVFDERRYFAQGSAPVVFSHAGEHVGVLICEDGWFEHNWRLLKAQAATRVLVINASPFEAGKQAQRREFFGEMARKYALDILYVNMAGAQDDLVFDGASFALDKAGKLVAQAAAFDESIMLTNAGDDAPRAVTPYPSELEAMWRAISSGLANYIEKNHIANVVLGLSGGIDSAVVAALAVDALGAERVHGVLMPSEFTSDASNVDAKALADLLGVATSVVPIGGFMDAAEPQLMTNLHALAPHLNEEAAPHWRENLTIGGNLQARFRGNILMAYSNALGGVVLNTSNKSEIAVGYSTMYGDACGAFSPLKDVYKTDVYALAHWRNQQGAAIPTAIIDKAPTAELKPDQQDSDQLPDYASLDVMLHGLIEQRQGIKALVARGGDEAKITRVYNLLLNAEYKRRQFPPGPKVSSTLFGRDWRCPLTNGYKG